MVWTIALIGGGFLGMMGATILISVTPAFTIRILETLGLLKKGEISSDRDQYTTGAGYVRSGLVYKYADPQKQDQYATKKVAGRLYLICIGNGLFVGALTALLIFLTRK